MRPLFEILRIIFLFLLLGSLGWLIIGNIYNVSETTETYGWLGGVAVFMLIFVLYRNKLQFTGWFQGENKQKLPKKISNLFIFLAIILIILPFVLDAVLL